MSEITKADIDKMTAGLEYLRKVQDKYNQDGIDLVEENSRFRAALEKIAEDVDEVTGVISNGSSYTANLAKKTLGIKK